MIEAGCGQASRTLLEQGEEVQVVKDVKEALLTVKRNKRLKTPNLEYIQRPQTSLWKSRL